METDSILAFIGSLIITIYFRKIFFGEEKRMGYTYAAQARNSKLVGKYCAKIFIISFIIILTFLDKF
ncbi:hypothetical protein FHR24_001696 [Wenyingzhuangia heitensis]|uniref:Solute:Na+ symporter, SSS family n=1 Tax=Wenyingzhuangia heitensis TaxID=1487859 RepID=A0ABX0UDX5_9FLAO|nr:hypothetical protein [Wenyingzhuangia heitensis]NIJ45257.1 hypothetical protein [Wenyingzhuangia heitensis]